MNRKIQNKNLPKSQSGFTLLESLLTLFILVVGLLGVAGLQMQSLRSGGVAMDRISVVMKTQELIDRIRLNAANAADYNGATGTSNGCNTGVICSPLQMVAHDVFLWQQELNAMLPASNVVPVIAVVPVVNGQEVTVTVTWDNRGDTFNYSVTTLI